MYIVISFMLVLIFSEIHSDSGLDLDIKEELKIIK
jgi:hypothetical protein